MWKEFWMRVSAVKSKTKKKKELQLFAIKRAVDWIRTEWSVGAISSAEERGQSIPSKHPESHRFLWGVRSIPTPLFILSHSVCRRLRHLHPAAAACLSGVRRSYGRQQVNSSPSLLNFNAKVQNLCTLTFNEPNIREDRTDQFGRLKDSYYREFFWSVCQL